jgi:hypothetical protein
MLTERIEPHQRSLTLQLAAGFFNCYTSLEFSVYEKVSENPAYPGHHDKSGGLQFHSR